jgi:hypothetical protein
VNGKFPTVIWIDDMEIHLEEWQRAAMEQLEHEFLHGTSIPNIRPVGLLNLELKEDATLALRRMLDDLVKSPEGMRIISPPRRKGPPSRDARKDRWG